MMSMKDFLEKEGMSGGLKGIKPPDLNIELWGAKLWAYLKKVCLK